MSYDKETKNLMKKIRLEEQRQSQPELTLPKFAQPTELLTYLKTKPVQNMVSASFLSFFLRRFRIRTSFKLYPVAAALDVTPDILTQFESSSNLPWNLPAADMAKIATGYRLHIDSITMLTTNSYELARVSNRLSDPKRSTQEMAEWLQAVRLELERLRENSLLQ